MVPVYQNIGGRSVPKHCSSVTLVSVASNIFETHANDRAVIHLEKCFFLLISSNVSGLLVHLQIFSQFEHIGVIRFLACRGLPDLWGLMSQRLLTMFDTFVFFANFSLLFSVIYSLECVWMGSLDNSAVSIVVLLKTSFLILLFSYYALKNFVMTIMNSITILLSMVLISSQNVIRFVISGKSLRLASDLESDIMDVLNNLNIGKTQLISFDVSRNSGVIDLKIDGSILDEKSSLTCENSYIISIAKTT